jgi:hypothetical protein
MAVRIGTLCGSAANRRVQMLPPGTSGGQTADDTLMGTQSLVNRSFGIVPPSPR